MYKLIIDAGSTKTEWIVLNESMVEKRFTTRGFNPNYSDYSAFIDLLYQELPKDLPEMDSVFYYGSGCGSEANRRDVEQYLKVRFDEAKEVKVTHDLMAVCHAVLGHEEGIACILGTGANSCLYDGADIIDKAISLGYLVGDEGSGCYIGKKVVRAYFYELLPLELELSFEASYHLEIKDFIHHVYHESEASKYLAQFTKFAGEHQDHPYMHQLVKECFDDFIKIFVLRYKENRNIPVSFVGSVAYYFQNILKESLLSKGLTLGTIAKTPAEGLIKYYKLLNTDGATH